MAKAAVGRAVVQAATGAITGNPLVVGVAVVQGLVAVGLGLWVRHDKKKEEKRLAEVAKGTVSPGALGGPAPSVAQSRASPAGS